jgi:hypothetical protein
MASPNLSEIVTTTLRNRSKTLSDNMSNHNALLRRLRENGNQTSVTGRDIVRELEYADNGTNVPSSLVIGCRNSLKFGEGFKMLIPSRPDIRCRDLTGDAQSLSCKGKVQTTNSASWRRKP